MTNANGRPNSRTAITATASVENSSRLRIENRRQLVAPLEAEPDATHGGDIAGVLGVVPQLAPQPGDMHVEGLGGPPPLAVPDLPHDLLPRDHLARLVDQHRQQVELLGGEVKLGVA